MQLRPSVTNPTIAQIYHQISDGTLVLQPVFQRRFVWTLAHQESFIDTILKGLPFPEIYVSEGETNVQEIKTTRLVIDGQQRLTTIRNYIEGSSQKKFVAVVPYKELTDAGKANFLGYQVVVRDLGAIDEATTREVFRRINLTKFKLDDVEIHNAVYDGHFIQVAKSVLDNVDLMQYGVLRESEFTRMADLHFILLVMSTIEYGGYFAQDGEVEAMVSRFNDEYPGKEKMIALLKSAFDAIRSLALPLDSMWFRKSNFFTLVVEIALHINTLPKELRAKLLLLERNVIDNRTNSASVFYEYYSYMYQATHGRKARVVRSEFFRKYCIENELE